MSEIFGLLNLNSDIIANFALQSHEIDKDIECERILRRSERRLKEIETSMPADSRPNFKQNDVDYIVSQVINALDGAEISFLSVELRIISYNLHRFVNNDCNFEFALRLLDDNWHDIYLNGLFFYLISSWHTISVKLRKSIYAIVKRHLSSYSGNIRKYQVLKQNIDFFDEVGPQRLSKLLRAKNFSIEKSPEILGLRPSDISRTYFSDVIISYVKNKVDIEFREIENILEKHRLDRTRKLIYANLIEDIELTNDIYRQDLLCRSARHVLGDINLSTTWSAFVGATSEDEARLQSAKEIIKTWGARQTVEAFFNICVQDPRRKKNWLNYIGQIADYRIVGSTSTRVKLQSNSSVAPLLRNCFIETNSHINQTAALVLFIRDKIFVEFSDVGSLYIYNSKNRVVNKIKRMRSIDSIADLKDTSIGRAVEQNSSWGAICNDEGCMRHSGDWEARFNKWMSCKLNIQPGEKKLISNYNSNDYCRDDINCEQQISSQNNSGGYNDDDFELYTNFVQKSLFDQSEKQSLSAIDNIQPGARIKEKIQGFYSKWIFDNTCRLIVNKSGLYILIKRSGRTYFLTSSIPEIFAGCNIWLKSQYRNNESYEVQIVNPKMAPKAVGIITTIAGSIEFNPFNSHKVELYKVL